MTTGQISLTEVETSIVKLDNTFIALKLCFFQNMSNNHITENSNICL